MFLGRAVLNAQHQQAINALNEQITSLKQQVENQEKLSPPAGGEEIKKLEEPVANNQSTQSAKPLKSATPSAKLKTASQSGEKK